jgi:glutamyl-tRNA synthetase
VRRDTGAFVMRVEDLDGPRTVKGAEARILEDLRWLGLDWDEGPEVGGPFAPYRQSERQERYAAAVARLIADGRAFECFCSRADVQQASQAPHGPGDEGPRYPGTCRELSSEQRDERRRTRRPSIRLRVDPEELVWTDGFHGVRADDVSRTVGDFVLRRADGIFAYQLAVVVDDAQMEVSDVLRGDDLLSSTARQLYLYRALDLAPPRFSHVPLVLGPDGARLSKRHGAVGVRVLRERGVSAGRAVALLASTLGLCAAADEVHPSELVPRFELSKLPRTPTTLDPAAL